MTDCVSDEVYFIGIGGVGMSGIALIAHDQGLKVSGSDLKASRFTAPLEDVGIEVHIGHDASNLPEGNPTIVVSTAILDSNCELMEAKRRGLTIVRRAEMLAHLGRNLKTLAVAGTHGKTTTSSMLASILDHMGKSPTFLIGGMVREYGSNAHSGTGEYYVVEADESDKSFTHLSPSAVIVTNIEADHLDHYADLTEIHAQFGSFISLVPKGGPVVVCAEDKAAVEVAKNNADNVITYGTDEDVDVRAFDITTEGISSKFKVRLQSGRVVETSIKQNPGIHNVLNGTACLALLEAIGEDVDAAALALSHFQGVRRRFDLVGVADGVTVVDDYAHHPTEIAATIAAAKQLGFNQVHVIFQPHRYSRAKLFAEVLKEEFGCAFDMADTVTFMDVYPAGEEPIPGVNGRTFMNVVLDHAGHPEVYYVPRRLQLPSFMADIVKDGDLVMTLGAGDITEIGAILLDVLEKRAGVE